jgi:hypothetical protein
VFPSALIHRRDLKDLLPIGDELHQVLPREVLRDGIADQISDLAFARLAIALRHLLVTASLIILRIEAAPRVGLIESLWIGAAHREIDVLHAPVVRIAESEYHMIENWLFTCGLSLYDSELYNLPSGRALIGLTKILRSPLDTEACPIISVFALHL